MSDTQENQAELFDGLSVDNHWFHVMRGGIRRGLIAQLGTTPWAVYCVLKANTDLGTGTSNIGQPKIADLTGLSVDTIARATDKLIKMGLVRKSRVGRHSEYMLIEEVPMTRRGEGGQVVDVATARRDYVPVQFQDMIAQLQALVRDGAALKDKSIQINFNLITGEHATVTINQTGGITPGMGAVRSSVVDVADKLRAIDDV
jgi:hypothetical protein